MSTNETISLRGVRVHNLQSIDVDIPLGRLTVVCGVSGAGKSSLVFGTLYAEAQRRYLQSFSPYTRQFLEKFDQPDAEFIGPLPPAIAVRQRGQQYGPRATVGTLTEILNDLRLLFTRGGQVFCPKCGREVHAQNTADVLAAIERLPAGRQAAIAFPSRPKAPDAVQPWADALREDGFVRVQIDGQVHRLDEKGLPPLDGAQSIQVLVDRVEAGKVAPQRLTDSIETAFNRGAGRLTLLTGSEQQVFQRGMVCPACAIPLRTPEPRLFSFNEPLGACPSCHGTGVKPKSEEPCPACQGRRWNDQVLCVRLGGKNIAELAQLSLSLLDAWMKAGVPVQETDPLLAQLQRRLSFALNLGLGHLTLDRAAGTLSPGEASRLRLTSALASNLVRALYLFDEPSAGLHAQDTGKLLNELCRLRDAGNTVVVIEHDLEVIAAADHLIELGPGAGEEGGQVVYQGAPAGLGDTLTGEFLRDETEKEPARRRPLTHGAVQLHGVRTHTLQNLTVDIPLGVLCAVTGVSGAGKRSLVEHTLYPALCRVKKAKGPPIPEGVQIKGAGTIGDVVLMDQTPLPRTARSNLATYLKIFDEIRDLFADTSEARIRNFGPPAFSFNQSGGRCETCAGQGTLTIDMQFLADVVTTCPECQGKRYKQDILNVKVRGLDIAEVLELTVRAAFRFFRAQAGIERRLKVLLDVGLGYLRLGQPLGTLSGGECQRLKLAAHLSATRKPRTLFMFLEPANGLHAADVVTLLDCLGSLVDTGHSVVVVEHDLDVIRHADHVIDLSGGEIVAAGTPEHVARTPESATGRLLQRALS